MSGLRVGPLVLALLLGLELKLPAHAAEAQPLSQRLDTTVSLRGDVWSGSRQLDDTRGIVRTSAWARAKLDLGDAGKAVADGWIAAQSRDAASTRAGRVRELYWQFNAGPIGAKVGRQAIAWGRADGVNPTDNLSPRDFTLLVPQDNEQRRGNDVAALSVDTRFGSVSALWFPRAASHTVPLPREPQVNYAIAEPPHKSQWAVKLDMAADGIDGSVSYFDGTDPTPDLSLAGTGPAGLTVGLNNQPLRVLGADVSLTHRGVIWRAEAAWMRTGSTGAADFLHKKPRLWLVAGAEWTLAGNTTLGLQASAQRVMDFRSPDTLVSPLEREVAWRQAALANQTSATQLGLIWRLASRWMNDTLTAEASGVLMASSPGSSLWRTRLAYAIDDHWQLHAGTDHYTGPRHSLWGQFRANRLAFAQLRYGW